jgi:uncharacterized membrane-anchored protein
MSPASAGLFFTPNTAASFTLQAASEYKTAESQKQKAEGKYSRTQIQLQASRYKLQANTKQPKAKSKIQIRLQEAIQCLSSASSPCLPPIKKATPHGMATPNR